MKLSKLRKLLESGSITQEEYDGMAKTAEDDGGEEQAEGEAGGADGADPEADGTDKNLEKLVQAAVDRVTNRIGNENRKLKGQLDAERKKNLSADELRQVELQEKEQELARQQAEIQTEKNRMYAVKALKKAELDDGSEDAMDLIEFVLGDDETAIDLKVKALQKFAQRVAKSTTDGIYKANGRTPGKGNAGGGSDNPWGKDSWNLTKQMELELNNPELAKALRSSAGK